MGEPHAILDVAGSLLPATRLGQWIKTQRTWGELPCLGSSDRMPWQGLKLAWKGGSRFVWQQQGKAQGRGCPESMCVCMSFRKAGLPVSPHTPVCESSVPSREGRGLWWELARLSERPLSLLQIAWQL